ncbi:MAG: aldehyde dehydrogenase family protein [Kofleriaceae bacterium]
MTCSPLITHHAGYGDGRFLPTEGRPTFAVRDPATGDVLAELPRYDAATVAELVDAAAKALATPTTVEARAGYLRGICAAHLEHRDELARLITLENGKPLAEAKVEVEYAAGFYRAAADEIDVVRPRELAARPKGLTWTVHARPAGVAGLITPWNFPLAMLAKKLAGAVAGGAPAVIKPAEKTPLSPLALVHLIDEAEWPAGAVNLVFGDLVRSASWPAPTRR